MSRIIKIKNDTITDGAWVGQTILAGEYHDIALHELNEWTGSDAVFAAIGSGELVVNKGADDVDDILDATMARNWMLGDTLPLSDLGNKLGVHQSTKPEVPGKEFFLVWTGAGDDIVNHEVGMGELLTLNFTDEDPAPLTKSIDVKFDPVFGDVYLHEGYMRFGGATTCGPFMTAQIITEPSPIIDHTVSLDLLVTDNWVTYSPGGPGTGTHGFAGNPVLLKRSFSHDGDWNYDATNGLTPNFEGDGVYKISDIERIAHRYINKVPICGENGYVRLTSDETAYLPPGYFIRIIAENPSQEALKCAFFFEVYRERTAVP